MKFLGLILLSTLLSTFTYAQSNKLGCENVIKFSDYNGMSYLNFMQEIVKPVMDEYATDGYVLADRNSVAQALKQVDYKVRRSAISAAKGEKNLLKIADQLAGTQTDMYELPELIAKTDGKVNRYKLATFFGLVSCAGAIIEFAPGHYAYNIHYGTGQKDRDQQTGRSFAEGDHRKANDASDSNYLKDLEKFGKKHISSMEPFYMALVKSLAMSDAQNFEGVSNFGKLLLTDFLAVYTAEQARNLMDGRITLHWDAALLEVTLLEAFHSGQSDFKLFYKDPYTGKSSFTDTVYNQDNGCSVKERAQRKARMQDYWQFSSSTDPKNCKRSGINITKREFRKLGRLITKYELKNNPHLIKELLYKIGGSSRGSANAFKQLSSYFIRYNADKYVAQEFGHDLAKDFVKFLIQVRKDADIISEQITSGQLR